MSVELLEIKNLTTSFLTDRGVMKAVDGVSLTVHHGEILGLVGESGCGKSVTSQSILRLYDEKRLVKYQGEILFQGNDILAIPEKEMQSVRGKDISMVFQDALSALNPVFTVGAQIVEALEKFEEFPFLLEPIYREASKLEEEDLDRLRFGLVRLQVYADIHRYEDVEVAQRMRYVGTTLERVLFGRLLLEGMEAGTQECC